MYKNLINLKVKRKTLIISSEDRNVQEHTRILQQLYSEASFLKVSLKSSHNIHFFMVQICDKLTTWICSN